MESTGWMMVLLFLIKQSCMIKKMTEWIKKGNHSYGVYLLDDGTSVLNKTELHDKKDD